MMPSDICFGFFPVAEERVVIDLAEFVLISEQKSVERRSQLQNFLPSLD